MQSLKSLTIPGYMQFVLGGTDRILSNAFSEEFNVTSMVVEEGVETIPAAMARSWTSMQTLKLPSTITSIGANAFSTAKQLHSVDMSKITGALTVKTVFNTWGQGDPVDCIFYVNNSSIRDTLNADNWGSERQKRFSLLPMVAFSRKMLLLPLVNWLHLLRRATFSMVGMLIAASPERL